MILNLGKDYQRFDIVFDIYSENSIKASAKKPRKKSIKPMNALTGCDTLSKICCQTAALKIADTNIIENLVAFGKTDIVMIITEDFLLKCIDSKTNSENFDELRME